MQYMRGGSILKVDLDTGKVHKEPTAAYVRRFVGGHGINMKLLYDAVGPEVKGLDPENLLIFGTGPLTGTMAPGSGRTTVAAKSPQSGLMGRSNFGGYWAPELKYAGYDHLVISGRAAQPVYIAIDNERVEIREAGGIWGMDTYRTATAIKKELGEPQGQVVCIGPAGEKQVVYATVMSHLGHGGGKTGMGAVMGSKNLKAIVVRGTRGVRIANPERFKKLCFEAYQALRESPKWEIYSSIGTTDIPLRPNITGDGSSVVGNYQSTLWEKGSEANITQFFREYGLKRMGCFNCPVRCMEYYLVPEQGPVIASCASYLDPIWGLQLTDLMLWYEVTAKCQRYGIDPSSAVGMICWATELYEKGIIDEADTDGVPMIAGSRDATVGMIDKITKREGFGEILAGTVQTAVDKIGRDSADYMMHTKGIPLVHKNRLSFRGPAIAAATGNRGDWVASRGWAPDTIEKITADLPEPERHMALSAFEAGLAKYGLDSSDLSWDSYAGKASLMALQRKLISVTDMLLNCKYHTTWSMCAVGIELQSKLLSAGDTRDWPIEDLMQAAERIHALERAYNFREGFDRRHDTLPRRFFTQPIPGVLSNDVLDHEKFERAKDEYYVAMGWDIKTGAPNRETLLALVLDDVATDLLERGLLE